MNVENNCVYRFIERAEASFRKGESVNDVLGRIDRYQAFARRAYGPNTGVLHRTFTSRPALTAFTYYEFIRARGLLLPSSNIIIQSLWFLKVNGKHIVLCGRDDLTKRPQSFDF